MQASLTFALIDHDLTGPAGHNLTLAPGVLAAAGAAGLRTVAGINRAASANDLPARALATFASSLATSNPAYARRWHLAGMVDRRRRLHAGAAPATPSYVRGSAARSFPRLAGAIAEDLDAFTGLQRRGRILSGELSDFIGASGLAPGDIAFMPTVLAGEVVALELLVANSPLARSLRWRLLFRYAPDEALVKRSLSTALKRLRRRAGLDLRLFTDTEELQGFYQTFCDQPFELLPIPATPPAERTVPPAGSLMVGYFGDLRDEKGADLLPELISHVLASARGSTTFFVQSNLSSPFGEIGSRRALDRLHTMAGENLELVDGPLSQAGYDSLCRRAHIVLLPYRPAAYAKRSSGILMEALAGGVPVVTTEASWMSRMLAQAPLDLPAGRATPADYLSLAGGVLDVAMDWARFRRGAEHLGQALRHRWDVQALVARLMRSGPALDVAKS